MSNSLLVRRAAVLGAGVMGAQIAAHLTNAGVDTVLFDLPAKEGPADGIVLKAIANLGKLSPAPLASKSYAEAITPANYETGLEQLKDCDLIIEAIAERIDWKQAWASTSSPTCCPSSCATASAACISSTRRATCTWPS